MYKSCLAMRNLSRMLVQKYQFKAHSVFKIFLYLSFFCATLRPKQRGLYLDLSLFNFLTVVKIAPRTCQQSLKWDTLENRRTKQQLTMLYRITNDLVAISSKPYLKPAKLMPRSSHILQYLQQAYSTLTDTFKYIQLLSTDDPLLEHSTSISSDAEAPSLAPFKSGLHALTFQGTSFLPSAQQHPNDRIEPCQRGLVPFYRHGS